MQFKIYTHLHRVTYADCSNGNHVYYGRYSYFLEEARGEFFRYLGITFNDYHKNGYLFPVSEFQLKYFAPAEYDDELIIECNITCLLYTSPSPRDRTRSRMPSSA